MFLTLPGVAQAAVTAADNTVTTSEDTTYLFTTGNFNYSGDGSLAKVQVTALPAVGALTYTDGGGTTTDVTSNQEVSAADITAGRLRFRPAINANGAGYASFSFRVSDGAVYSDSAYVMTINVTAVNDAPTSANFTLTLNEDTPRAFALTDFPFTDPDAGSQLQQVNMELPTAGTLEAYGDTITDSIGINRFGLQSGALSFRPAANAHGNGYATLTFAVTDGMVFSGVYTITFNVVPVNDAPHFVVNPAIEGTVAVNSTLNATATVGDVDGDDVTLSYQWQTSATGIGAFSNLAGATGSSYTTSYTDAHQFLRVVVTASDGHGGTTTVASAAAQMANTAPIFTGTPALSGTAAVGNTLTVTGTGTSDVDHDLVDVTYQWQRSADGVAYSDIDGATGALHALTTADAHRYVRCAVTADDHQAANHSVSAIIAGQVVGNAAPVAGNDAVNVGMGGTTDIPLLDNDSDVDGDTLTIGALPATSANGGTLVNHGSYVTYTGAPGWSGADSFSYTVSDGHGGSATADVSVTVYPDILLEDGEGVTIPGAATVASGESFTVQISGGSGSFTVEMLHNGNSLSLPVNSGSFTLSVPTTGAFAGDYVVTLTDTVTGDSTVVTVTVPLAVAGERNRLLARDPLRNDMEVTVRGAPAGASVDLEVDAVASAAGVTLTAATGVAEDLEAEGNPARFIVTAPDALVSDIDVELTADADTLAGSGAITATVPVVRAGAVFGPTGAPVSGVTITLLSTTGGTTLPWEDNLGRITAATGSDGSFTLLTPPTTAGESHSLQVTADGYAAITTDAANCNEAAPCLLTLEAETTAAPPTFSPGGGTYTGSVTVTIDSTTVGATLRYTLDGTPPSLTHGIKVANGTAVQITTSGTLRAIAYKEGLNVSEVREAGYTIQQAAHGGRGNVGAGGVVLLSLLALRNRRRQLRVSMGTPDAR